MVMFLVMQTNGRSQNELLVERGHGCWFADSSGRELINFSASALGIPLGYGNNIVRSAVLEAIETNVPSTSGCELEHDVCGRLGGILANFKPLFYDRTVLFFPSSDHALDAARQVAIEHTSRSRIIYVTGGSHGRDYQHLNYGRQPMPTRGIGTDPCGGIYLPFPGSPNSPINSTETLVAHLQDFIFKCVAHPYEIAAVVVPPVAFSDSVLVLPDDFLPAISRLCRQNGILLIVDETRLGVGVLGTVLASDQWDFEPDILCLGEPSANGFAFGAAIVPKSVLDFDLGALAGPSRSQRIACAVARAILKQSESTLTAAAKRIEAHLQRELDRIEQSHSLVEHVSGKGVLWSLSLEDRPASDPACLALRDHLAEVALDRGLFLAKTGMRSLVIAPPLVISDAELEHGLHILEEVLAELS